MATIDFKEQLLKGLGGPWPMGGDLKPRVIETIQKDPEPPVRRRLASYLQSRGLR